jgi:thiamine pyrophosphokinase
MIKCDVVVLANGDFPVHAVPLSLLENAAHIVACDGAIAHLAAHEYQADVVAVGDGDSVPDGLRDRLIQVDEQEDNDLTKATRYCLTQGWRRIAYVGATGKREDHTIGNISLIVRYFLEMGVEPLLVTDYGWFVVAKGDSDFESFPGQQVSIFNVDCQNLTSEGLKWQSYPYRQFWQGTLNEALDSVFSFRADGCYLVYRTFS